MKKKSNNLTAEVPQDIYPTLEQRVLHSNLSEEDKIELIQIIGRDRTTSWTTATPSYTPAVYTTALHQDRDCPLSTTTYCSCCSQEA